MAKSRAERIWPQVVVTRKAAKAIESGHLWVYDAEVLTEREAGCSQARDARPDDGGAQTVRLVDVRSEKGTYLGTGWLNPASKIRVRLLSRNANELYDDAFFERRVRYAWEYRKSVLPGATNACRVISSEADGLPGLTVDRYEDILVARNLCAGMEAVKGDVFAALARALEEDGQAISGVYERNDSKTRDLEGLSQGCGFFEGAGVPMPQDPSRTSVRISENGILYDVDFAAGQKTGFFLDQKLNRLAAARLARGKKVLDCFCHIGSFGLNCALAGAAHVHSVDISKAAIASAEHNAAINGLDGAISREVADVFDLLRDLAARPRGAYDYIILDPPAFAKTRKNVRNALGGYEEINTLAMRALPRGGYLAMASCSHFVTEELFKGMLARSARAAGVRLRQVEARGQAPDHPILWGMPESAYLKFFIFQVV